MGTTVKSAALYPHLNITAVELVPEVFQIFKYYHGTAEEILKKENIHTVVADGRNYLLLSKRKYDLITIDPAPPVYSAGTVNLYTKDFFTLCREHLNPEGVMCLWVPGYTQQEIKSFLKTFHTVFPNMMVWSGMHGWGFYLIGTMEAISWSAFQQNIEKIFANPNIIKDLGEYDNSCVTPEQLYRLLLWDKDEIDNLSKDGVLITDNFPYTEFPLWRYLIKDRTRWIPQEVRSKILEVK
jgi:spermidine synthase